MAAIFQAGFSNWGAGLVVLEARMVVPEAGMVWEGASGAAHYGGLAITQGNGVRNVDAGVGNHHRMVLNNPELIKNRTGKVSSRASTNFCGFYFGGIK